jgi:uroporphyrinogen-III synthase
MIMILYLGIDPSRFSHQGKLFHYPVIQTRKIDSEALRRAKQLWPHFTHVIFTSRSAVRYWFEEGLPFDKQAIAIGDATAEILREKGVEPKVAKKATQEGVIELLQEAGAHYFWPRSKHARDLLLKRFPHIFALDLYETVAVAPKPIPDLKRFREIVFTSPTTVRAFLKIFKKFPKNVRCRPIGPVTKMELLRYAR